METGIRRAEFNSVSLAARPKVVDQGRRTAGPDHHQSAWHTARPTYCGAYRGLMTIHRPPIARTMPPHRQPRGTFLRGRDHRQRAMNPACTRTEASDPECPVFCTCHPGAKPRAFLPPEVLGSTHHCTASSSGQQGRPRAIRSTAASFKPLLRPLAIVHRHTAEQGRVEQG